MEKLLMICDADIYGVPTTELYWRKEQICDAAFEVERKYNKTKNPKRKMKLFNELSAILDIQKKFDKRLKVAFG